MTKVLYALQATGNGHIARANVLVPLLRKHVEVDVFVSGQNAQLALEFDVKSHPGISLFYSATGGLNYSKIIKKNSFWQFSKSVRNYSLANYDLILNDYEPVTAYAAHYQNKRILGLSHQAAVMHPRAPKPTENFGLSQWIMKQYAPVKEAIGFHFQKYDDRSFYPILRESIIQMKSTNHTIRPYCLVYLPSFNDQNLFQVLSEVKEIEWIIYSPYTHENYVRSNCTFRPIDSVSFMKALALAKGVLCDAGFEFPAEVLFLNKMLFVIPIQGQFEQYCNYLSLKELGVDGAESLEASQLKSWLIAERTVKVNFKNETEDVIHTILQELG